MSSGLTVFFFDFDIFSSEPIAASSPVAISIARRLPPTSSILTSPGDSQRPLFDAPPTR